MGGKRAHARSSRVEHAAQKLHRRNTTALRLPHEVAGTRAHGVPIDKRNGRSVYWQCLIRYCDFAGSHGNLRRTSPQT